MEEEPKRGSGQRPKKRKAPVNRHLLSVRAPKVRSCRHNLHDEHARTETEEQPERPSSASEKKLEDDDAAVLESREKWSGLRVVDIDKIFHDILDHLICKKMSKQCNSVNL